MPSSKILDTHIHLWPSTSLTPKNHGWMTPGHILTKRHGISDYVSIAQPSPNGFIYVETDRYLPSTSPDFSNADSEEEQKKKLVEWANEPIEEIKFLRRIVEGAADKESDGISGEQEAELMKGAVIWAPFHFPTPIFKMWLNIAEEMAGSKLWSKVVGFRYLLQGKGDGQVKRLVQNESWLENIILLSKGRNRKGWTFDIGVDTNRDGLEGLEAVGDMIQEVRRREQNGPHVRFVLNHLCKHPLSKPLESRWTKALESLSDDQNVYMKFSGAFNEFDAAPRETAAVMKALAPFADVIFRSFPQRIIFGSDWPVCNVGGPRSESGNWKYWVEIVEGVLENEGMEEEEKERVWWKAGAEVYSVDV